MARWEPGSNARMRLAAVELYCEKGFDATTTAEIAARAGVTERTFFRHFADKREVLFGSSSPLEDGILAVIDHAPTDAAVGDVLVDALAAGWAELGVTHANSTRRARVIADTPTLRERETQKLALLASSIAAALRRRQIEPLVADLLGGIAVVVFQTAFDRWLAGDPDATLRQYLVRCRDAMGDVASARVR